jgi:AraC-like DNA-binding protein
MAARAVVFAASKHGVAPPELLAKVGLAPEILADIDGRVPVDVMISLWNEVGRLDDDFGLHLGEMTLTAPFALPWHLVRASSTLAEGVLRLLSAWRVFNDIHPPEVVFPGEGPGAEGIVRLRSKHTPIPNPRHAVEYAFAWFVGAARRATGTQVTPSRVTFEHPTPRNVSEHARIFGCEVRFDEDTSSLVYPRSALDLPTVEGDPELVELLDHHAASLLAKLPPPPNGEASFSAKVREAATPLLAGGEVSVDRVAETLGASSRSVQRHLRDEGTSFQRVIADLRKDVATTYLHDHTHSIAEIALLLGFSDQTAFHRAFVRWTGRTPGDVRRATR